MKLQTYNDVQVEIIRATPYPGELVRFALDTTMKKTEEAETEAISEKTLKFLMDAEHTSVLEHVNFTFFLSGVSRAFLAQITRHRIGSFTSASQHYQDYRDYPMTIHPKVDFAAFENTLEEILGTYEWLVDKKEVKPEEARMILPNASTVNIIWTVNARSLANYFKLRMCKRNVEEMRIVTNKILLAVDRHWTDFAMVVGPPCYTHGKCNQGRMSCGKPFTPYEGFRRTK